MVIVMIAMIHIYFSFFFSSHIYIYVYIYIYMAFSARRKNPRAGKSRKAPWQKFPTCSITFPQNEDPNLLSREEKSALVLQTFRLNFL